MVANHGNIHDLQVLANLFCEEPNEFISKLKKELALGNSFPKAREKAAASYLGNEVFSSILLSPNNILGIEYLKALKKLNSSISPFTIKRFLSDYSSLEINASFASSTAIRNFINLNELDKIKEVMPEESYNILINNIKNKTYVNSISDFEKIILYKLRMMGLEEIKNIPDVSEGLENTLKKAANENNVLNNLIEY